MQKECFSLGTKFGPMIENIRQKLGQRHQASVFLCTTSANQTHHEASSP